MFQARVLGAIDTGHSEGPGTPGSTGGSSGGTYYTYNRPYTTGSGSVYQPPPGPYTPPPPTAPPIYNPPSGSMPPPLPTPPGQPPLPPVPGSPPQTAGTNVVVGGGGAPNGNGYAYPATISSFPKWALALAGLGVIGIIILLIARR